MSDEIDVDWDENLGGQPDPDCLLSFPKEGRIHNAMKEVWPWRPSGVHARNRVVVPSVYVERLFKHAPVPEPADLKPVNLISHCLSREYLAAGLELLVEEGLLTTSGRDDDDPIDLVFGTPTELSLRGPTSIPIRHL